VAHLPLNPLEKILFLYIFAIGCPCGESYEMEFPKDALMNPPGEHGALLEGLIFWTLIRRLLRFHREMIKSHFYAVGS
jgi:hypothetical protein